MVPIIQVLDSRHIRALTALSRSDGFPCELSESLAADCCRGKAPADEGLRTYGAFVNGRLVSVMSATFCRVFPCADSPGGRIVHISGAYTERPSRGCGCASALLGMIEADAAIFGADYLCCDSIADGFYLRAGFVPAPENETRMWKSVLADKEAIV